MIVPVAPREPFQLALVAPLFELRQATPALPPSFKLPKHQAERTPDAAGFRLKPAPRHRITLIFILFANKINRVKGAYCPSCSAIHPVFNPLYQVLPESRTSKRQTPQCPSDGKQRHQHRHRRPRCRSTKPNEHQTPPDSDRSQPPDPG